MILAVYFFLVMCAQLISHVLLFVTPRTVNCQALLSIGILPWDSPGDLPDPGIKPMFPALADGFFFITEPPRKPFLKLFK